jgi:hypothetical protein
MNESFSRIERGWNREKRSFAGAIGFIHGGSLKRVFSIRRVKQIKVRYVAKRVA